ncbi:MAG: PEP-CTERM sorting domain-containing protein [Burkholderiales bacterium]|nr:PEP-CTERM sorting domain-containing protein [Opitutaceae bacterium]
MKPSAFFTPRAAVLAPLALFAASVAGAATIPFTNDFSSVGLANNSGFTLGSGFQTLSVSNTVATVGYSNSQFTNAANTSFTLTSQFRITSLGTSTGGVSQSVGFGFFGTEATFAGGSTTPYLYANWSFNLGTLSIIEVDATNTNVQSGTPTADLNGATAGFITPGSTLYTLKLAVTNTAPGTYSLSFGVFDSAGTTQFGSSATVASYSIASLTTTTDLDANGFYGIRSRIPLISGTTTVGFDNFAITSSAIPEPSTYAALAGLGVLGLAASRRRRA